MIYQGHKISIDNISIGKANRNDVEKAQKNSDLPDLGNY